ncbi:hypothetical protein FQZ97_1015980 [compost metagenome]
MLCCVLDISNIYFFGEFLAMGVPDQVDGQVANLFFSALYFPSVPIANCIFIKMFRFRIPNVLVVLWQFIFFRKYWEKRDLLAHLVKEIVEATGVASSHVFGQGD